jgi:hypothetical protein
MACVIYKVSKKAWVNSINYIEKEISLRSFLGEELIREEGVDFFLVFDQVKNLLDTEFFVFWDYYIVYPCDLDKSLFSYENLLNEVLIITSRRWKIVLKLY